MKILVFSDSHGFSGNMKKAAKLHSDTDVIIHLGDGASDVIQLKKEISDVDFHLVIGNCDVLCPSDNAASPPQVNTVESDGFKIFMCHGHTLGVKSTLAPLTAAACNSDADIALFGHTHNMHNSYIPPDSLPVKRQKGLYIFNPGSISIPSCKNKVSYGIIELKYPYILLSHGTL